MFMLNKIFESESESIYIVYSLYTVAASAHIIR